MLFEQAFCYLKIGCQSVFGWAAPIFDSCGFSATLSSALLMTHNQLPRLVCIDAKVAVQRVN